MMIYRLICNKLAMKFEVEKKARLKNPAAAARVLAKIASRAGGGVKEDRYYLLRPGGGKGIDFRKDPIFRLRIEKGRCWLTAKKRSFRGKAEINEEVEIPAGKPRETLRLFEQILGLVPFVVKRKRTRLFMIGDIRAEINFVDRLGWFLEVEILRKKLDRRGETRALARIQALFDRLGIREEDVEPRYYIQMLMEQDRPARRACCSAGP
jgi:predicted adenylyl cyclase CyaB